MTDAFTTPRTADVAIIGSGIVGLSCAFHLREQGREVLMIDPSGFGNQTSHGNAGSISIGDVLPQSRQQIVVDETVQQILPMLPFPNAAPEARK